MSKVKLNITEHDTFRLYLEEDHSGYFYEVPQELYEEYKKIEEKYQSVQNKIRTLMKTSSEIDEDRADVSYQEGDKVLRVYSEDPLFPVGAYAKVKAVNNDDKILLLELEDGSQYTAGFFYVSKVIK